MINGNIVLIGMPSAGKSTIGEALALKKSLRFIDTDSVVKEKAGMPLRDIVNTQGLQKFLEIQEESILELQLDGFVIATGGAVVYGKRAMEHLSKNGTIVFLQYDYSDIEQRVTPDRRFARNEGQSLMDLYNERMPLYKKYADIIVECTGKPIEDIVLDIEKCMLEVKK